MNGIRLPVLVKNACLAGKSAEIPGKTISKG
jgi:hypothetical protein